jgi:tetratricopeptide (TPR) repeat protein
MLLFDAIDAKLKPVVAQLQHASRNERGPALYDKCVAAMKRADDIGDDAAFVLIAQSFGLVIDQHGYSEESIAWLLQAVERAKRCGEFGEQSHLLHLIGRAYYSRAEYRIALNYWTDGMEVALRDNDSISWSWCKLGIGQVCDALDAPAFAVQVFTELGQSLGTLDNSARTLPLAQRARFAMRLRELRVINAVNLGVNVLRLLDYDRALDIFTSAQAMASTESMIDIACECEVRIAEVYALRGDAAHSLTLLIPAQTALEKCSHHWGLATLFLLRAKCQADLDNLPDAMESNALAREAAGRANAKHIALRIEREAAVAAEKLGDLGQALQCMKRAAVLQTELDHGTKSQMLRELHDLASMRSNTSREHAPPQAERIGKRVSARHQKRDT